MNPYLQLLLQKRPQLYPDYSPGAEGADLPAPTSPTSAGPTIALGQRLAPVPAPMDAQAEPMPLATSQPLVSPRMSTSAAAQSVPGPPTTAAPTIPLKRDVIAEDRQRLLEAQNAKPPSLGHRILEGIGEYAASGVGFPLHHILHPRGSETEQAQRQLNTDVALQNQQGQAADTQSTIALRSAQARKIQSDLDNPDTSDEDRARFTLAQEILRSHPQGFDPSDPADVVALEKLKQAGIPIPRSYGRQLKPEREQPSFSLNPGEARYDSTGKLIVERAGKPEPEPGDVPDTTSAWVEKEKQHRTLAQQAQKSADDAQQSIIDWQKSHPGVDPATDLNVANAKQKAASYRKTAEDQNKLADEAQTKRIEAAGMDARAKGKVKTRKGTMSATPTLQGAIDAFKKQHPDHRDPTPDEIANIKKHYGFQ